VTGPSKSDRNDARGLASWPSRQLRGFGCSYRSAMRPG
jgi:hypothetical protein